MQTLFAWSEKNRQRPWIWLLALAAICLVAVFAVTIREMHVLTARGEREVQVFRELFGNERYSAIYASTDQTLRERVGEEQFTKRLESIRGEMGDCRASKPLFKLAGNSTGGKIVRLVYGTECTNGRLNENFVFLIVGDNAELMRYDASKVFK